MDDRDIDSVSVATDTVLRVRGGEKLTSGSNNVVGFGVDKEQYKNALEVIRQAFIFGFTDQPNGDGVREVASCVRRLTESGLSETDLFASEIHRVHIVDFATAVVEGLSYCIRSQKRIVYPVFTASSPRVTNVRIEITCADVAKLLRFNNSISVQMIISIVFDKYKDLLNNGLLLDFSYEGFFFIDKLDFALADLADLCKAVHNYDKVYPAFDYGYHD